MLVSYATHINVPRWCWLNAGSVHEYSSVLLRLDLLVVLLVLPLVIVIALTDFFVVHEECGNVLPGFRELSLFHALTNIPIGV